MNNYFFFFTGDKIICIDSIWNMDDLNKQPLVVSENDWVNTMAFTPDDQQIMAGVHSLVKTIEGDDVHPIRAWPTDIERMKNILCDKKYITKNLTKDEWEIFVAPDLPYEKACPNLPDNNQ